jgi:hypothetical protein
LTTVWLINNPQCLKMAALPLKPQPQSSPLLGMPTKPKLANHSAFFERTDFGNRLVSPWANGRCV